MPTRPRQRCSWPGGCAALVSSGRCPAHQPAHTYPDRGSSTARGYGHRYRQRRAELLADNPPCHWCGAVATEADHVPPLATAATPDEWQGVLVPACRRCNAASWRPA
jgi:hypothetical protein